MAIKILLIPTLFPFQFTCVPSLLLGQGLKEKVKKRVINELEGQCLGKNGYVISVGDLTYFFEFCGHLMSVMKIAYNCTSLLQYIYSIRFIALYSIALDCVGLLWISLHFTFIILYHHSCYFFLKRCLLFNFSFLFLSLYIIYSLFNYSANYEYEYLIFLKNLLDYYFTVSFRFWILTIVKYFQD